ncbi:MAG: flavin reductase family protein [Spirochaetes bacterium]|nr:flavin reductase family protein [Spirochaetota bacterium]MCK5269007.1 flavin reductase family protein [Spirochaetota bacterium]
MKREIDLDVSLRIINNGPLVIIGSKGKEYDNASSVAWVSPSTKKPPALVIFVSPTHQTWDNIEECGDFSVNVISRELIKHAAYFGGISARDIDKLSITGFPSIKGKFIESPFFPMCMGNLECRVTQMDRETHMITAEVMYALADEEAFFDHWKVDSGFYTVHHLGGPYYQSGTELIEQERLKKWSE